MTSKGDGLLQSNLPLGGTILRGGKLLRGASYFMTALATAISWLRWDSLNSPGLKPYE